LAKNRVPATHQRDQRQRIVIHRIGFDEPTAHGCRDLGGTQADRGSAAHERPHARPANEVDRDAGRFQGSYRADMRKAARAAARQHQADGTAGS